MRGGRTDTPQVTEWPPNPYFGEPWDVPAVEGARQVPTPVGEPCAWCETQIADGDQGFLIPGARLGRHGKLYSSLQPWHRECLLRTVVGSPARLDGTCRCHGGGDERPHSPAEKRGEAVEVWDRIQSRQIGVPRAEDMIHDS